MSINFKCIGVWQRVGKGVIVLIKVVLLSFTRRRLDELVGQRTDVVVFKQRLGRLCAFRAERIGVGDQANDGRI